MKRYLALSFLLLLLLPVTSAPSLVLQQTSTMTIVLEWDANHETDLAGYHIYQGTSPGTYGAAKATVSVSPTPTWTSDTLPNGTYYWVVTAFNTAGLESGYSNEVSATIASAPAAPTGLKKK